MTSFESRSRVPSSSVTSSTEYKLEIHVDVFKILEFIANTRFRT